MEQLFTAIRNAWGNYQYLFLFLIFLLFSIAFFKNARKSYAIPLLFITIVVINPYFYSIWNNFIGYAYFRALWMIPIIPVCATIPAVLIEKTGKRWLQVIISIFATTVFVLIGTHVYSLTNTGFIRASNADKLPQETVQIAETLLKMDDEPYVVATAENSVYLRMYSGKIHEPYSREIIDAIPTEPRGIAQSIYSGIMEGRFRDVAQIMIDNNYKYFVINNSDYMVTQLIEDAGFELICQVGVYGIYQINNIPSVI